jgi:hypothetical protein
MRVRHKVFFVVGQCEAKPHSVQAREKRVSSLPPNNKHSHTDTNACTHAHNLTGTLPVSGSDTKCFSLSVNAGNTAEAMPHSVQAREKRVSSSPTQLQLQQGRPPRGQSTPRASTTALPGAWPCIPHPRHQTPPKPSAPRRAGLAHPSNNNNPNRP